MKTYQFQDKVFRAPMYFDACVDIHVNNVL